MCVCYSGGTKCCDRRDGISNSSWGVYTLLGQRDQGTVFKNAHNGCDIVEWF